MAKDDSRPTPSADEELTSTEKRPRMSRPQEVSALLASIFGGKPAARLLKEIVIWQVWDEVVGPQVARRARPSAIRDGVLTVTVASGPWLQQLTFLKAEIISRLNEKVGEGLVREIYLKAGNPLPKPGPPPPALLPKRDLTPEERAVIDRRSATILDDELRDLMEELMVRHSRSTKGRTG
jgi:hypothetical protein